MQRASSVGKLRQASGTLEHPVAAREAVGPQGTVTFCHQVLSRGGRPERTVMGFQSEVSTGTHSSCSGDSSAKSLFYFLDH